MNCFSNYVIIITSREALGPTLPPVPCQPGFLPEGKAAGAKNDSSNTFTYLLTYLLNLLTYFTYLLTLLNLPTYLLTLLNLLTYLLTYLLNYLLTYLLTYLFTYSLTYLLTYLLTYSLTHSLTHSLHGAESFLRT